MSEDLDRPNETKREYTEAERLMNGLYAIEHLIENYAPSLPVGNAYDTLVEAARTEYHRARERNLAENGWVFEEELSPLIHPDYTDPCKRRPVVVAVLDAAEGDLRVETAGPFPMVVGGEEEPPRTINSEEELIQHFEGLHGSAVTTIRPMPFAASTTASEDGDGYEIRDREMSVTDTRPALRLISQKKAEYRRANTSTSEGQRERDAVIAALDTLQTHLSASL